MQRTGIGRLGFLACAVLATALGRGAATAATCEKWAGKVVSAQGVVEVKPAGQAQWQPVKVNEAYCPGDTIRTDRKSRADIALSNHPVLRLDQNSTVTLGGMKDERTSVVDMIAGAAFFFSRVTRNLEVRTATVNAGVEGTEFFLRADDARTEITVFEGKVLAANAAGVLPVATGQSATTEAGKAPVYRVVVRPRDAVRWALYYPPVIDSRAAAGREGENDPRFYARRASQSLSVGRVDEANADIDRALGIDPANADALALRAVVAVVQNETEKAIEFAGKAVAADPKSATALIARSYAEQARFDLPAALRSADEAVRQAPENALAWVRLAELRQSFGDRDASLAAARRAAALSPDLSRTQTVLGFASLSEVRTREAREAFGKAIRLDDADPLPRLGLGLATIRDGRLEEGRREIEIAMSLDPDSALLRSYLGKAYYEEKRDKLASAQYEMARMLDPKDPTPWFYDAIGKQTANRPVEALQDMQGAIERNDNRAVYRSRLLLDQDLAARSASLARIYGDLGFQNLALVEGWKSVNTDPANYSAHRFLSDSYSALPRREIARVSELLQSQMLQPANVTPIQPHLAEGNLFAVSGGGPSGLSFNEFNPMFERNRVTAQADGIIGGQRTRGGEIVAAGLDNGVSASAGHYHFESDGFRPNADIDDDISNVYFQASLTPKASVQAEFRYRDRNNGDLKMLFHPENVLSNLREDQTTSSFRLGVHYAFSPASHLLVSGVTTGNELVDTYVSPDPATIPTVDLKSERRGNSGEIQHLFGAPRLKTVAGAGFFKVTGADSLIVDTVPFGSTQEGVRHADLYLYSYLAVARSLTVTAGASGDFFRKESVQPTGDDLGYYRRQLNPKLGITWNPVPGTTLRAAAFRTLRRTLTTNATLEPTQVAGFNQFYDEAGIEATSAWNYGVAADQKFSRTIFGGAEAYRRDLKATHRLIDGVTFAVVDATDKWKEHAGRGYLYWTPCQRVALNAEYLYERSEWENISPLFLKELTTRRLPLGAGYFDPSGVSVTAKATYWDQTGSVSRATDLVPTPESVQADFWLVDAAVGYRLPGRYGVLAVGVRNLFDKSFSFYDTDFGNPSIQPVRTYYAKVNLSL